MKMDIEQMTVILSVAGAVFGGSSSVWFWYDKKKNDKEITDLKKEVKDLNDKVIQHANIHITESQSRHVAEEVVKHMENDLSEVKQNIQTMMSQVSSLAANLQTHAAITKLIREEQSSKRD